jgi:hypothetical protein
MRLSRVGSLDLTVTRICMLHPGVDQACVQFDEFTDADGPIEVDVADACGDTVAGTPLCGSGAGGLVDPFE